MSNYSSVSDLSRAFHTRLANNFLNKKIEVLSKEVSTGIRADIASHLGGDLSIITQLEDKISRLTILNKNAHHAELLLTSVQDSLQAIQDKSSKLGPSILAASTSGTADQIDILGTQAMEFLSSVISSLNTSISGRSLFGGSITSTSPFPTLDQIIAGARLTISGATTASDIDSALSSWLDAPFGDGGFFDNVYQGNEQAPFKIPVSPGQTASINFTAHNQSIRDIIKGALIFTIAGDSSSSFSVDDKKQLFRHAGLNIINGNDRLSVERASIGAAQETVAKAILKNESEMTTLAISRNKFISADPFETALALKEAESGLKNIYTLTARLSTLSLTDYLR
ncbi:flagellin N-terminal helical domain-containing protein [Paracoccus aminophilus]|uniref:flagellin N-terminal helical domain-containing protein n=1 Tax=Paracoccus aminophilus TaxID=34003 RepID=UPI0009FDAC91|nr:hypothetical protein [Paracoccus aminophilus]